MSPKKNIAKVAVGDIVRVVFDDHAEVEPCHESDPIVFEVFGRILSSNKRSVNLATWLYAECNGDSNIGTIDSNCVVYTILRSCMISMHRLLPEPIEPHAKKIRKPKAKPTINSILPPSDNEGLGDAGRNSGTEESSNV
jgi:hypothetical protein